MPTRLSATLKDQAAYAAYGETSGGQLRIYSGPQPATANSAPTGTLLCTIPNIYMTQPVVGSGTTLLDMGYAPFQGTGVVAGEAGWARLAYAGGYGVDGSCGLSGEQFNLSETAISIGGVIFLTSCTVSMAEG